MVPATQPVRAPMGPTPARHPGRAAPGVPCLLRRPV